MTIDQKTVFVGQELTGQRKVNGHSFYDLKVFYLMKPPMSEAELPVVGSEISNSFDGQYRFDVFRHNDDEGAMLLGGGYIEIKNGEMIIEKDKRYLKPVQKICMTLLVVKLMRKEKFLAQLSSLTYLEKIALKFLL